MAGTDDVGGGKALWHITVALAYEGGHDDPHEAGVEKVLRALNPLLENGSGIKRVFIMRLPEKA